MMTAVPLLESQVIAYVSASAVFPQFIHSQRTLHYESLCLITSFSHSPTH